MRFVARDFGIELFDFGLLRLFAFFEHDTFGTGSGWRGLTLFALDAGSPAGPSRLGLYYSTSHRTLWEGAPPLPDT